MVTTKQATIKTADFEKKYNELIRNINELERTPKTAILSLLEEFKGKVISYEPREEIEIYKFMEVR